MKVISRETPAIILALAAPLTAAISWMFVTIAPKHAIDVIPWVLGIVALIAMTWLMRSYSWSDGVWHPLVGVGIYVTLVCFGPIVYLLVTDEPLGALRPEQIQNRTIIAMALTVAGMLAGITVGLVGGGSYDETKTLDSKPENTNYVYIATLGTLAMGIAMIGRLVVVALAWGSNYGSDQINVTNLSLLGSATESLIFIAVILSCLGNIPSGRLMTQAQWLMLLVFASASMASGDRGSLLAPAVFLAFAHHRWVRGLPLVRLAPLGILVVLAFVWVGQARVSTSQAAYETISHPQAVVEKALYNISSPYMLTNDLVQRVPEQFEYTSGSSYLAAIRRQIPGPLSLKLFGPPSDTGAMVYREVMSFSNPNMGYSFAFPAEAYINFGLMGNLAMSCGLGWLFGAAYRWNRADRLSPRALLYPILLGTLILGFRTDALGHMKFVLYPMLIVTAVWMSARRSEANGVALGRISKEQRIDDRGIELGAGS